VGQLGVVDASFQLVDDDLVLLEVGVVVALVADAVVFVGGEVGTKLVDLLEGQALRDAHLALLLPPLLVVQLDYPQVLELQLLLLAPTHLLLLLAVLLVVRIEVVLLVLRKRVLLTHTLHIKITHLKDRPANCRYLLKALFADLRHFEVLLRFELIIGSENLVEVVSIGK
jgi:hypothetical protein